MFRPWRKSRPKPPETPTPVLTPTSSVQSFIQKRFSTLDPGDVRTLAAASSVAVASSIGSPSSNQSYQKSSDPQKTTHTARPDYDVIDQESSSHQAADSAWRTEYSAAKMAITIANECSDAFPPLKAVTGALSVLITNYDRTASNLEQIKEIEQWLLSLSDVLRSPGEDDRSERERRTLLCGELMGVLDKLELLSKQNGLLKFLRNEDNAGLLNGFTQDITRAITHYQISLGQNTYENTKNNLEVSRKMDKGIKNIIEAADRQVLDQLSPVHDAGYQAEHHERCLDETRVSVLKNIMDWAQNTQDQRVYWLNGLAGTGKSTIAQTFSEMANNHGILGASFFCSRDYSERNMLKNIFPTLGYQLAFRYSRFRDHLLEVIKQDPSVVHNSLTSQLRSLLVAPLSAVDISCVIVIDALDECVDDKPTSAILSVLGCLVGELPRVKFFITGRPESRIRSGFRLPLLRPFTQIFLLHEVDSTCVEDDIRRYLRKKLTGIAAQRSDPNLSGAWPSDEDITILVEKSSGLFIFASTVVRFIESEHDALRERLRLIVSKTDDTSHEGASGIDSLYSQVLRDAFFGTAEESVFVDLKRILSAVVLAVNPLSRDGLAQLLNMDADRIFSRLRHLHSVILVPDDGSKEIRVFHKSFPDFLQDSERCRDSRFHIDSLRRHGDMALSCLDLIGKLERNPYGLPPFAMNKDVLDCQQSLKDKLGSGSRYACKYWSTHLSFSPPPKEYGNQLITSTSLFFDRGVFPWMEIMSLEGHLEGVIHSMNHLLGRTDIVDGPLRDVITDCLRFTLHFFRPIQMSARHIYHTAFPLSPETSVLRSRLLKNRPTWEEDCTTQQVLSSSIPTPWGPILRTISADSGSFTHVTAAGQRIVAVCNDNTVNVYDAVTGVLKLSLKTVQQVTKAEGSPDGSILFFAHQHTREITAWDTQTGGLIHTFTTTFEIHDIAVSLKGKYLASCSSDGTFGFWEVESRCEGSHSLDKPIDYSMCWLEPEDQIALALKGAVAILEVTTGRMLRTIPIDGSVRGFAFRSTSYGRDLAISLAYGTENMIGIIDIRMSFTDRLGHTLHDVSGLTFSANGDRVICTTKAGDLLSYRPRFSPQWEHHLSNLGTIHSMSLLRSGHLVVNSGGSIQLLEGKYDRSSSASLDPEITRVYQLDNGKVICSPSRDHKYVDLLDMETMKTLAHYRVESDERDVSFTPRFVCASTDQRIAVLCPNGFYLKLYSIDFTFPRWKQPSSRPVLLGALSPDGSTLITVTGGEDPDGGGDWELCARRVSDGEIRHGTPFIRKGRPPSNIAFISGTQFYTEDLFTPLLNEDKGSYEDEDNCKGDHTQTLSVPRTAVSKRPEVHRHKECCVRKTFSLKTVESHQAPRLRIEIEETPGEEIVPVNQPYALDESLEWVVDAKLRKVCWLPPGYITGTKDGHFFVDSSIVMAGRDGVVRRLTFRNPSSDS